jgi:hypothetical protein
LSASATALCVEEKLVEEKLVEMLKVETCPPYLYLRLFIISEIRNQFTAHSQAPFVALNA